MPELHSDLADLRFAPPIKCFDLETELIKERNRQYLAALPRDEAQRIVDSILQLQPWQFPSPVEMAWPGDLADEQPPYPWEM